MKRWLACLVMVLFFPGAVGDRLLWAVPGPDCKSADIDLVKMQKEEEERRKKLKKKSKIVLTNESLKQVQKSKSPGDKKKKDADKKAENFDPYPVTEEERKKKADPKQKEKYWRALKASIEKDIRDNKHEIKKLETKYHNLQYKYNNPNALTTTKLQIKEEIDSLFRRINNRKRGLETLKKKLAGLRDEARRAGVPPGWVR